MKSTWRTLIIGLVLLTLGSGSGDQGQRRPRDRWSAPPNLEDRACREANPLPWCDAKTTQYVARNIVPGPKAVYRALDLSAPVADKIQAAVSCWANIHGYAKCGPCLAPVTFTMISDRDIAVIFMVYPSRLTREPEGGSVGDWQRPAWAGPELYFFVDEFAWIGPGEMTETPRPCSETNSAGTEWKQVNRPSFPGASILERMGP